MENHSPLNPDHKLITEIIGLNEQLEEETNSSANYAFNLGCLLGIIPAILIVIIGFFLTGRSWLAAVIISILMLMGLMLFANFVAHTSRERTLDRVFYSEIEPKLSNLRGQTNFNNSEFKDLIDHALPAGAALRNYTGLTSMAQDQEDTDTLPED